MKVAILGGTGPQGQGLAMRLAVAGIPIILGSREKERCKSVAADLNSKLPKGALFVEGTTNEEAIRAASDMVIFAVPWGAHNKLLENFNCFAGSSSGLLSVRSSQGSGRDGLGFREEARSSCGPESTSQTSRHT